MISGPCKWIDSWQELKDGQSLAGSGPKKKRWGHCHHQSSYAMAGHCCSAPRLCSAWFATFFVLGEIQHSRSCRTRGIAGLISWRDPTQQNPRDCDVDASESPNFLSSTCTSGGEERVPHVRQVGKRDIPRTQAWILSAPCSLFNTQSASLKEILPGTSRTWQRLDWNGAAKGAKWPGLFSTGPCPGCQAAQQAEGWQRHSHCYSTYIYSAVILLPHYHDQAGPHPAWDPSSQIPVYCELKG